MQIIVEKGFEVDPSLTKNPVFTHHICPPFYFNNARLHYMSDHLKLIIIVSVLYQLLKRPSLCTSCAHAYVTQATLDLTFPGC